MRKVIVSLFECQPGIKIAETIFNEYGAVVVGEDTILDDHILRKLNNLGIVKIKVYDETDNIISANSSDIFKAQYNENVEVVKDLLHDISAGKNVDMKTVDEVSDSIFIRINENRDIVSCINQIRDVDEYTYTHSVNVSLLSMLIGKWLRLDEGKIKQLVQTGLLHDIGKGKIAKEILNKPTALTQEEFEEIKKHPIYGYRMIENMPNMDKEICMGVLMHHEREDGSGYPTGAKGPQISFNAKVVAIADIYDAMTSERSYRVKGSPFEAFEVMENKSFGVLDPRVTAAFLSNIAAYYIGDFVRLNTGEIGEIVYINPRQISRPVVRVGNGYIDLSMKTDMKILELI